MNKKILSLLALGATALTPVSSMAYSEATPLPDRSQMQTHIKLNIKDETKAVHFINTNNDPDIFTKTYVLKYADPYELRPYLMSAVKSERVKGDAGKIEVIKYEDGTGVLIVSAEDYRFDKPQGGMSIDEIITTLDLPKVSSSSGHKYYLYFPKYWDASSLKTVIDSVGLNVSNDPTELEGGRDKVSVDTGLNAMLFYTPPYSVKTVENMLKLYDTPTSEALIKYTIYEISSEDDGSVGVDFQSWKNGPGADLFAAGSRWTNGWDPSTMAVTTRNYTRNGYTQYVNFSPKWNTKYLDYLAAKSHAKIITAGQLSIMNNTEGYIQNITSLASIEDGAAIGSTVSIGAYQRLSDAAWDIDGNANAANNNRYRINSAIDYNGNDISLFKSDGTTNVGAAPAQAIDFTITKSTVGTETYYYMKLDGEMDAYFFSYTGQNLGKEVRCLDAELQRCTRTLTGVSNGANVYSYAWVTQTGWQTDRNYSIAKNIQRDTKVNGYGFKLSLKPSVCEKATSLSIDMTNTNLIGFKNDGVPRTTQSEVKTTVMVENGGQKFVVGGLDKKELIRSVSKVPWLGDIPGLGWIFSSESEIIKKSQIVAVIECIPAMPKENLSDEVINTITGIKNDIDNFGIKAGFIDQNDYGFNQFLLDKNKTSLDPLP